LKPPPIGRETPDGIIPSTTAHGSEIVNDQYDITYQYIESRTSGVMYFKAPGAGKWDIRMHDTDAEQGDCLALVYRPISSF